MQGDRIVSGEERVSQSCPPQSFQGRRLIGKVLLLSLPVMLLMAGLFSFLPRNPVSYFHGFTLKDRLLGAARSPKVILLGCSNLAFGIDSAAIQRAFGCDVVNMGLHGGLGLSFVVNSVDPRRLHHGDTVVMALEYGSFRAGTYQGNVTVGELVFEVPHAAACLGYEHVPTLCEGLGRVCWLRLLKTLQRTPFETNLVYNAMAFNRYGDVVSHLTLDTNKVTAPPAAVSTQISYRLDPSSRAGRKMAHFVRSLEANGVRVVFVPPCLREQEYLAGRENINANYEILRTMFPGRVLSKPEEFVFGAEYCFDTEYHLNARGREMRTDKLIACLREADANSR